MTHLHYKTLFFTWVVGWGQEGRIMGKSEEKEVIKAVLNF